MVWKGENRPLIFGVRCSRFGVLGNGVVGLKLCISPLGRVMGPYPSLEGHLVYPWYAKAGKAPPLIFVVPVLSFLEVWGPVW